MAGYAVILRRSALVTAIPALVMIVLSGALGGGKGLVGALLGVGLVIVFFGISAVAMSWASRKSPQVTMVTAASTYLIKILVLFFLVIRYSGTTAFNGKTLRRHGGRLRRRLDVGPGPGLGPAQGSVRRTGRETVTRGSDQASGRRSAARRPACPRPGGLPGASAAPTVPS